MLFQVVLNAAACHALANECRWMRFSAFIETNLDAILQEWDAFAKTLLPAAATMSDLDLRDHAREILLAIAHDMETSQTEQQRSAKSKGVTREPGAPATAASTHGAIRQLAGFELVQLVAEFRAMRASVLGFWSRAAAAGAEQPAAEEIARFNEALDQALAESVERFSEEVAKSRDMFLAVLGHEVRGPLSGIKMSTDALLIPTLTDQKRNQVVMRIRRASDTIGRLTSDLLDYTRSRLGRGIPLARSTCDLRQVCEEALDIVRGSHPEQKFTQRLSGDLRGECDGSRMQQVIVNLLNNAVEHGEPGVPVTLEANGEPEVVVLKVTNFGKPIPPNALQVIFEPLVQLPHEPAPHRRLSTGLGLGLFIVSEIVGSHQGTVAVESSADAGTTFTIKLPRGAVQLPG